MLLELHGIRIECKNPLDQERMKSYGYKEVKGVKAKADPKTPEAPETPEDKMPAGVKLAVEALGLENPEALSSVPDKKILKVQGIGKGLLKALREDYPLAKEKDGDE